MHIGVLGTSFKSADIGLREWVSRACQRRISSFSPVAAAYSCVVLSTCNRTEIYFSAEDLAEAHSALLNVLREEIPVPFEHKLYSCFGFDCFLHLAKVAAGLDSAIVAESEIQRQVKISYEQTLVHYALPSCLHFLFQKSLKIGKQIRTQYCLAETQVTIPKLLLTIGKQTFQDFTRIPMLFIGNSEINRKVIAHFRCKGVEQMTLCSRSPHLAKEIADREGIDLLLWERLSDWHTFPLVICGSNAPYYLISGPQEILQTRLIFDLGVPRNVDPSLGCYPRLSLLNIEELGYFLEAGQRKNSLEISRAEVFIQERVHHYLQTFRQKGKRAFACA